MCREGDAAGVDRVTLVTPRVFEQLMSDTMLRIAVELADLVVTYQTAYEASWDRVVHETTDKVSGGVSDPVAAIVGDPLDPRRPGLQAGVRRTLERAPKKLVEIESVASAIRREIEGAMAKLEPPETFEIQLPKSVSPEELDAARAAQARRRERGETG
jgi:hypothetical protein